MTPEQRLKRAERILITMIKSGRRTRSEWRYKINSLIDAQIRHEAVWSKESAAINEQLREVATAQVKNEEARAELTASHKLTEKAMAELAKSQKVTEKSIAELTQSQKVTEKSIAELTQSQKVTEKSITELTQSQKVTDKALRAFIDSLRKGRNGKFSD